MERLLEPLSFAADESAGERILIDADYVNTHLSDLSVITDLSRFMPCNFMQPPKHITYHDHTLRYSGIPSSTRFPRNYCGLFAISRSTGTFCRRVLAMAKECGHSANRTCRQLRNRITSMTVTTAAFTPGLICRNWVPNRTVGDYLLELKQAMRPDCPTYPSASGGPVKPATSHVELNKANGNRGLSAL